MDYEHDTATRAAVDVLPRWAYEILKPVRERLIREYSHNLDRLSGNEFLNKHAAVGRDGLPLHYLPDSDTMDQNYDRTYTGSVFYFQHLAECFARGRADEGAVFAAMLFHFLQDAGYIQHGLDSPRGFKEPGSCTPYPKLLQLFPPPAGRDHENAAMLYKKVLSRSPVVRTRLEKTNISGYLPRLLGVTPEEASFHLYRRYWDLLLGVRRSIPGFCAAVYDRDRREYAGICGDLVAGTARACADVLYTALCLARGKFAAREKKALDHVRLEQLVPLARPSYSCTAAYCDCPLVRDYSLDTRLHRHRLALLDGRGRIRYFRHGLGTGMGWREPEQQPNHNSCDYDLSYRIPPGVYRWFTVTCGVNAALPHNGRISLHVRLNRRDCGSTGIIEKPGPAKHLRIDIRGGGILDLAARNEKPDPLSPPFPQVHIVWADPVLGK